MGIFRTSIFSLLLLTAVTASASGEIVVVTKPLADLSGAVWSREYFDVNHALFEIPAGVTFTAGINPSSVRPGVTRRVVVRQGRPAILDAWVNIIDLQKNRYYAGDLKKWFPLDSTELIQIREGYDTCAVYMRTCYRSGAPPDSCRAVRLVLHERFSMSDIAYIIFSSFDFSDDVDRKISSRSQYSFRSLLGYVVRDIALERIIDFSLTDAVAWPVQCSCMHEFSAASIRKVEYLSDIQGD